MNLAYFRKSARSYENTLKELAGQAQSSGFKLLGEADLPENSGKMLLLCRADWLKSLLDLDHNLVGFLPCGITVLREKGEVLVGTGQTAILKALAQQPQLADLAAQADGQIKGLVNGAAGVQPLKPSSVRLYSTMSCPYCRMEKQWLDSRNIKHEVIYVDLNQQEAQNMVQKTGQMGVPVTEIQYQEGEPEFIIGFDRPRLEQVLDVK